MPAPRPIDGRYSLVRVLGAGGFAEVWLATDGTTGAEVALKLPRRERSGLADGAPLPGREFAAASRLDHPHIVRVLDAGTDSGEPYLVLEYVPGPSLRERLSEDGPLPAAEVTTLARELCSALDHAHSRGILHNDLKPENVLLGPHGAKLTDFGAAANVLATLSTPASEQFAATLSYMAPEVLQGERPSPRSDIYALGLLLYEASSGQLPWPGGNPAAVAGQRLALPPAPLREVAPGAPGSLAGALERALDPAPERRFASPAELLAAIEGSAPTVWTAVRTGGAPRASAASRRKAGTVTAVLGSVAAGVGLIAMVGGGGEGNGVVLKRTPSAAAAVTSSQTATSTPSPATVPATEAGQGRGNGAPPPEDRPKPKDEKPKNEKPDRSDDDDGDDD